MQSGSGAHTIGTGSLVLGAAQTWTNNSANPFTVSAPIGGTFGLTIAGAGPVVLTGDNSAGYTTTTIDSGSTLRIGDGGGSGSPGSGGITDNGSLILDRSDTSLTLSAANAITGSGSLAQNGTGTVTLLGQNSFSGGAAINAGTLIINGNGNGVGGLTGAVTINAGATLIAENSAFGYLNNPKITSIAINGGTLERGPGPGDELAVLGITMTGGSMTGDGNTGDYFDVWDSNNALTKTTFTTLASANTATISAPLRLRQSDTPFTVASGTTPAGVDLLVSGLITQVVGNGAFIKSGPGAMMLTNAGNSYGATTISDGAVIAGADAPASGNGAFGSSSSGPIATRRCRYGYEQFQPVVAHRRSVHRRPPGHHRQSSHDG